MANTFQRSRKLLANEILGKLKPMVRERDGLKWWTSNNKNEETANDVEITAYILMALLESSPKDDYSSIFNWLLKQRNNKGGFGSTHDTVVGLQALIKYAEKAPRSQDAHVKVHYVAKCDKCKNAKEHVLEVDNSNELILQKEEVCNCMLQLVIHLRTVPYEENVYGIYYKKYDTMKDRPDIPRIFG